MRSTSTGSHLSHEDAPARRTWAALGTTCTVLVSRRDVLASACAAVEAAALELIDKTYSRFRADSELTRLNARAGAPWSATPLLAEAISTALRAAVMTDGAVDPTVGRAMRAIGYDTDYADLADRDLPLVVRLEAVPGWKAVSLDAVHGRVSLLRGVELDLGSVGKALAADRAAAAARRTMDGGGVLVGLGGDIAVAGDGPEDGWPVLVAEDSRALSSGPGEVVRLTAGALATSSTTVRRWTQAGTMRHHLIDPATGAPAVTPWRTATVLGIHVRRRQYGLHGSHHQGRSGDRMVDRAGPSRPAGRGRWPRHAPERLAGRRGGGGVTDQVLWFATRGAGTVSLLMLTGVVALGVLSVYRWQASSWPRFLTAGLHRNLSLLALVFLSIHIVTAIVDPFTALGLAAAVIPFASSYRPLWVGLGVIAVDLLVALIVTSLVRGRLGQRAWRAVHWLAYACWPLALAHGIGSGSDASAPWMLGLDALCVGTVGIAVLVRLVLVRAGSPDALLAVVEGGTADAPSSGVPWGTHR